MDSDEIERTTKGIAPLTDIYPKRLSDQAWDEQASRTFGSSYMAASSAMGRFRYSPLMNKIWPETLTKSLESYFVVREARYFSQVMGGNGLAELDLYLRHSRLRTPVLEVLQSDQFRFAIAQSVATKSAAPPAEIIPDLIAGALARRDFKGAIRLLESQKELGVFHLNDLFLLTYIYCLDGQVEKAEALVSANSQSIQKDWFVDWLWNKLQAEFGFRPPT